MSTPIERVIVLAAGEGFQLDGFNKLLIRHPVTRETILDQYLRLFDGLEMTVVVGFKAIAIMERWPALRYVHTPDWRLTNNSYSLGLALDERPSVILSCDFFLDASVVATLLAAETGPDAVLAVPREQRGLNALNLELTDDGRVASVYQGAVRSDAHPEAPGIFKASTPALLRQWQRRCMTHPNLFALQNLPLDGEASVRAAVVPQETVVEVNTPQDYINLIERTREDA